MLIFAMVDKFDPNTGKPIQVKKYKETRCDFTGELISSDLENHYVDYRLEYGDRDPCFGACGEEFEFGQKYNIENVYSFLYQDYHFINDYEIDRYGDREMMEHFIKQDTASFPNTFAEMCRASRIATATRLLEAKTITSDQLSSE